MFYFLKKEQLFILEAAQRELREYGYYYLLTTEPTCPALNAALIQIREEDSWIKTTCMQTGCEVEEGLCRLRLKQLTVRKPK